MRLVFLFCILSICQLHAATFQEAIADLDSSDYGVRTKSRSQVMSDLAVVTSPEQSDSAAVGKLLGSVTEALGSNLSIESKAYLMRMLGLFGGEESVSTLYPALAPNKDNWIRESARAGLSILPGENAEKSLRNGLQRAPAGEIPLYMYALSYRGDREMVQNIAEYLSASDPKAQRMAALSLAVMADSASRSPLWLARDTVDSDNRLMVESALVGLDLNADAAKSLAQIGAESSVRSGAFLQLLDLDSEAAYTLLKKAFDNDDAVSRANFLRATMLSNQKDLHKMIFESLSRLSVADQVVVIGAVSDSRRSEYESFLISYLKSDEKALRVAAVDAIGWVGSDDSFEPLYSVMLKDPSDEFVLDALARVNAPLADERVMRNAGGSDSSEVVSAIRIMGLRNSPGARDFLNSLILTSSDQKVLEAAFSALEKIGDMDSVRNLLSIVVKGGGSRRSAQRSLKRLSVSYGVPELQWEEAYELALSNAKSIEDRESVILILDGVACEPAMDYLMGSLSEAKLRSSVIKTLKRWTRYKAGLAWVDLASREDATDKEKATAVSELRRVFSSKKMAGDTYDKARVALKAVQKSTELDQKLAILSGFEKDVPSWKKKGVLKIFKPLQNDSELKEVLAKVGNK